jgi:type II secretion system protein C
MKHPLWILNIILLILVLFAFGFMFISRQKPKARAEIEPTGPIQPLKGEVVKINISKIYENDLFDTYKKEYPTHEPIGIIPMPEPPSPKSPVIPPIPAPQFIEPLNISLKGIIIMLNDDAHNRAIIADNKTNKEATYRVGQMIEDAQVIQILSNKVILLRSNGQQEVIYLREKDAQRDPVYVSIDNWEDVIQKISENEFTVSPREFVARIPNLGQFIDTLDLITVYKQGTSFGCRVGNLAEKSLGKELGLQTGDIITSVNNIPALDTKQRFEIYKIISEMNQGDSITATLLRGGQEITITYILKDFKPAKVEGAPTVTSQDIREEQLKILHQKHKFAPTLKQIRDNERKNMLHKGKAPASQKKENNEKNKIEKKL